MSTISFFSPSEIERETGFGKEQLRKWRQRYGFPPRESTLDGQSSYSRKTVDQLHLIKRLLEAGFRPGQLVGKTVLELEKLKFELGLSIVVATPDESTQKFIEYIKLAVEAMTAIRLGRGHQTVAALPDSQRGHRHTRQISHSTDSVNAGINRRIFIRFIHVYL